jgi:hypothetical protein
VLAPHPQLDDPGNSRLGQDAWLQPEDRVGVCLGLEQAGMTAVCWLAYLMCRHFAADGDGLDFA